METSVDPKIRNSSNGMKTLNDDHQKGNVNLGVQLYNLIIILIDFTVTLIKFIFYTIEGIINAIILPSKVPVKDEIVLITGAAHGIGRQLALQYSRLGARVVCWDINEKGNLETTEQIKAEGGRAYPYVCNVIKRDDVFVTAKKVQEEIGTVAILINNAGIMPCHRFTDHTEAEITTMFGINVLGNIWVIQAFLPAMIEANHGHIVTMSSCAGLFGLKNLVPYNASKFAVRGLMVGLSTELRYDPRKPQIKLTSIYPYMVDTGLCKRPHSRFPSLMGLVKPEEAATAIIDAQQRGIEEVTIPKWYLYLSRAGRIFPRKSNDVIFDFCDSCVYAE